MFLATFFVCQFHLTDLDLQTNERLKKSWKKTYDVTFRKVGAIQDSVTIAGAQLSDFASKNPNIVEDGVCNPEAIEFEKKKVEFELKLSNLRTQLQKRKSQKQQSSFRTTIQQKLSDFAKLKQKHISTESAIQLLKRGFGNWELVAKTQDEKTVLALRKQVETFFHELVPTKQATILQKAAGIEFQVKDVSSDLWKGDLTHLSGGQRTLRLPKKSSGYASHFLSKKLILLRKQVRIQQVETNLDTSIKIVFENFSFNAFDVSFLFV